MSNLIDSSHDEGPVPDHIYSNICPEEAIELTGADLELGAEYSVGDALLPECIIIEDQVTPSAAKVNHHTGPINEDLIQDKRSRQKAFSKRLKTFQKQAHLLYSMCGARKIEVKVIAESGKVHQLCFPTLQQRNVKIQVGASNTTSTRELSQRSKGSPKKKAVLTSPKINNLPGKTSRRIPQIRQNNKCCCGVIYASLKDKEFKKKHKLQATWLGCDNEGCNTWGHAVCLNKIVRSKQSVKHIQFDCGKH